MVIYVGGVHTGMGVKLQVTIPSHWFILSASPEDGYKKALPPLKGVTWITGVPHKCISTKECSARALQHYKMRNRDLYSNTSTPTLTASK